MGSFVREGLANARMAACWLTGSPTQKNPAAYIGHAVRATGYRAPSRLPRYVAVEKGEDLSGEGQLPKLRFLNGLTTVKHTEYSD